MRVNRKELIFALKTAIATGTENAIFVYKEGGLFAILRPLFGEAHVDVRVSVDVPVYMSVRAHIKDMPSLLDALSSVDKEYVWLAAEIAFNVGDAKLEEAKVTNVSITVPSGKLRESMIRALQGIYRRK